MDDSRGTAIPVICGPTGAGKTVVAHWLAERLPLSIISADSRQIYRGYDIGTAKPSREERARVPYFGIDVLDPTERASAAWWGDRADQWITDTTDSGRLPVVVGGTGLYLRALFSPLFAEPVLEASRRSALEVELAQLTTEELRRWVMVLDPERARLGRTQLLRAIEIALLTGQRLSTLHATHARPARRHARYLVIDPGPRLRDDIATRTRLMFAAGWREEVRALMRAVPIDAPAWNGTGYRTIRALEEGGVAESAAIAQIITETRQYAKRQRTWFRHQLADEDVTQLSIAEPDWQSRALAWWEEGHA